MRKRKKYVGMLKLICSEKRISRKIIKKNILKIVKIIKFKKKNVHEMFHNYLKQ